jgi:hypothetical protein
VCGTITLTVLLWLRSPAAVAATTRLIGEARVGPRQVIPCETERERGVETPTPPTTIRSPAYRSWTSRAGTTGSRTTARPASSTPTRSAPTSRRSITRPPHCKKGWGTVPRPKEMCGE